MWFIYIQLRLHEQNENPREKRELSEQGGSRLSELRACQNTIEQVCV